MRACHLLLLTPLALAACGGSPPPPPPQIVIAPPPAPAPREPREVTVLVPEPSGAGTIVSQCQNMFAQSMAGQHVTYGAPSVAAMGGVITIRLSATNDMLPGEAPVTYSCSFNGTTLISAGRG